MFHLLPYNASIADATLTDVAAQPDGIVQIQNGHFVLQQDKQILFAMATGATVLNRARIVTPSFRQYTPPWIRPVSTGVIPASRYGIADYRANPLKYRAREELEMDIMQTTGGAARVLGLLGVTDGLMPSPAGDVFTMRGTSATACVANQWTLATVTWADVLPDAEYICTGFQWIGAGALSGRMIFEGQYWRPGSPGLASAEDISHAMFRVGGLGVWGRFAQTRMPSIELLCNTTTASHEFYMDFMRR